MTSIDPRVSPDPDLTLADAEIEPTVGRTQGGSNQALIIGVFALLAVLLFVWLNARRLDTAQDSLVTPAAGAVALSAAPPLELAPALAGPQDVAFVTPVLNLGNVSAIPTPMPMIAVPAAPAPFVQTGPSAGDLVARRRAPAVVVDFGQAPVGGAVLAQASAAPVVGGAPQPAGPGGADASSGPKLNGDEQFAARVGATDAPERARATTMGALGSLVSQGTVIPAVLETAINSDLPGYTRAVVSRDVLSFNGKSVLIPRGSRLIGQYKSAVALGQSRAFVIWTRVIRPDGVSIQIASAGTDALGRGGLEGDVDRHFFQRFGGSILLSVLNAGVASLGRTPSTQISIGSPGAAAGAAASALQGEPVSPTIKVDQGEAIRIFVTRDLDFSGVGAIK